MTNIKQIIKNLKSSTKLSELCKLDNKYRGVLIGFWRTYGNDPNFIHWLNKMETKDPDWKTYLETKDDIVLEQIEDNIIENEELSVTEKIALIREKYASID